jgi:hypothetical protein
VSEPENIAGPMFVKVEEPDTVSEPVTVRLFVKLPEPETSSLYAGAVVPIPTLPDIL